MRIERKKALRETAAPEFAQVHMEGIEVTLAAPDPFVAADASAPFKGKVQALIYGINQQFPKEKYCQIVFEILSPDPDVDDKPKHLLEAMQRIVRYGQGVQEIKEPAAIPEDRCAQYLSEDRSVVHCEFADMDVSAFPALMFVASIGRTAACTRDWKAGSTYQRATDEGYAIPNVLAGQKMIITQVPACNPKTRCNDNTEGIHKTNFVLVRLIMDECGNTQCTKDLIEAQLPLVDHSILSICTSEQEFQFRQNLVWEEEGEGKSSELTNASVVASNLSGTPSSGTDSFVANRRDVTIVPFVT